MTDDEESAIVGRKHIEGEEARRRLERLDQKSRCMEVAFTEILTALKTRRNGEGNVSIPSTIPTLDQVRALLSDQAKEQEIIRNVEDFFAARDPNGQSPNPEISKFSGTSVRG